MIFARHELSKREFYEYKRIIAKKGNSQKLDKDLGKYEQDLEFLGISAI